MADEAQLAAVFELCQPRKKDRKISLRRLESLFEEHTNSKVGQCTCTIMCDLY